jgi:hypothetical protein
MGLRGLPAEDIDQLLRRDWLRCVAENIHEIRDIFVVEMNLSGLSSGLWRRHQSSE